MANTLKNGQKDGARFSVYLRQNQLEWLDREAEKIGVSRSKFIEMKTFPKELQVLKDRKGAKKGGKIMTVFEKLNEARLRFQNAGVKKSGHNKFAGYTYYELADILPFINQIANELKFCCVVNFTPELATLDFCDLEGDGRIQFTSPMSDAQLKGCHNVQNLGAVETYIKRYLYQNCFEIVEADALDGAMDPNAESEVENLIKQVKSKMSTMTDEQLDFTNKAISARDVGKLKTILLKCK